MAPDLVARACPHCCAAVRPGAPWCTQCFSELGLPAASRTEAVPGAASDESTAAAATGPASTPRASTPRASTGLAGGPAPAAGTAARWPCTACGTANGLGEAVCLTCGEGFLAAVRQEQAPALVLPVVGDLVRLARWQRVAAALAVVLLVLALSVLVVLLLG